MTKAREHGKVHVNPPKIPIYIEPWCNGSTTDFDSVSDRSIRSGSAMAA